MDQNEKLVLTVEEMAEVIGISRPTAYQLIRREGFPAIRVSKSRIVVPTEKLREWLSAEAERGLGW